jgi:hypothetical protein
VWIHQQTSIIWLACRKTSREIEALVETEPKPYLAYMLRLWQEQGEAGIEWRAMLESPHTGERHGFTSLEALFEFLKQRAERSAGGYQPLVGADSDQPKAQIS